MLPSIISALTQKNVNQNSGRVEFKAGQLFFGSIKKIFPNQTASVQVGGQNLVAKLEAPLISGRGYWFQVLSDVGEIRIKALTTTTKHGKNNFDLIKQLSLPNSKVMKDIVSFLAKEQLPLSKESIVKVEQWMNKLPNINSGLDTLKYMIENEFPLSESIFKAILQTKQTNNLQSNLQVLEDHLQAGYKNNTVQSLLTVIQSFTKGEKQRPEQIVQSLLQQALSTSKGDQATAMALLKKIGIFDNQQSSKPVKVESLLDQLNRHQENKNLFAEKEKDLLAVQKDTQSPNINSKAIQRGIMDIQQFLTEGDKTGKFTQEEKILLKQLVETNKDHFQGKDALKEFKSSVKGLGIFYEADLAHNEVVDKEIKNSLKPLLVKYLLEDIHPPVSKEIAEQILLKMNGQQLLSFDSGPIQHLLFEIPVDLFGFKTDLTMQWSGKRTEDGKIDPGFCHILFYLHLEHLDEAVVEMKVQNRVISMKIFNRHPSVKEISKPLGAILKDRLKEMNYLLSAIDFVDSSNENTVQKAQGQYAETKTYSRMDFRI